jgi:rhamnopyranosyl-N-acetylglucosaminyl-diphospho-decaprenol beta-1,3/1,4-galactofuranosyltransferase
VKRIASVSPRVAAVVVTYNRPTELKMVVAALRGQSYPPEVIIVFDNGGPLAATDILRDCSQAVNVIRSAENLGGAGGFAGGLRHALTMGVDWIWLMDDDAVPAPEALSLLLAALPEIPERTGALCSAVREHGALARQHRRHFNRWIGRERPISLMMYDESRVEIDTGSFVGFLVLARAVREVGLPSADFFLAYDDTDFSLRLQDAGWRLWLVPGSVIEHLRSKGVRLSASDFGMKHYFNSRNRIFVKRRYAKLSYIAALGGVGVACLLWLLARGLQRPASLRVLMRAVTDGIYCRLGPFPADLAAHL